MKNFSPEFLAHLRGPVTTLAVCWRVQKKNGELILATTHDRDIVITTTNIGQDLGSPAFDLTGVYRARAAITPADIQKSSDMSVDNTEINGAIPVLGGFDVSIADIEAGLLDAAPATEFVVNWQNPDNFQDVIKHGYLGQPSWTAERAYRVEHRGLTQVLQQTIGRTAGDRCDVHEFGDARCKFPVEDHTVDGVITAVTSRRRFAASLTLIDSPTPLDYFNLGKLRMTSGDNDTYIQQVKNGAVGDVLGEIELYEPFPETLQVGDTFRLSPGCDRLYLTCRDRFDNLINMRAPALFCPGMDEIVRAP